MQIYYREVPLEEGFKIAELPKHSRIVAGKEVSLCSGIALFSALRGRKIVCWQCKAQADRWVLTKGQTDHVNRPTLNLYAPRANGRLVMMTRDHIIPKSLGGVDANENLRPGCEICNGGRGNKLKKTDRDFMERHPELISQERVQRGLASVERKIALMVERGRTDIDTVRIHLMKPYDAARQILEKQNAS